MTYRYWLSNYTVDNFSFQYVYCQLSTEDCRTFCLHKALRKNIFKNRYLISLWKKTIFIIINLKYPFSQETWLSIPVSERQYLCTGIYSYLLIAQRFRLFKGTVSRDYNWLDPSVTVWTTWIMSRFETDDTKSVNVDLLNETSLHLMIAWILFS